MTNLLEETLEALPIDAEVTWVGSADGEYGISWNEFVEIAKDIEYYSGYGGNEIPRDLVVVGDGWWLERGEYDGSEWWELKSKPYCKSGHKPFTAIIPKTDKYWSGRSLAEAQKEHTV